jgi:hypothetical protein
MRAEPSPKYAIRCRRYPMAGKRHGHQRLSAIVRLQRSPQQRCGGHRGAVFGFGCKTGAIIEAQLFGGTDDEAAIRFAMDLCERQSESCRGLELWQGDRLVMRRAGLPGPGNAARPFFSTGSSLITKLGRWLADEKRELLSPLIPRNRHSRSALHRGRLKRRWQTGWFIDRYSASRAAQAALRGT